MEVIRKQKDNLGRTQTTLKGFEYKQEVKCVCGETTICKNKVACNVNKFVIGINRERAKAKWQYVNKKGEVVKLTPVTKKNIAMKFNRHPMYKDNKDISLREELLNDCKKAGHFKKFWWVTEQV